MSKERIASKIKKIRPASEKLNLNSDQVQALNKMHNGCILCGGVGSGKSRTALAYYDTHHHGKELIIITTAKKRDTRDWQQEAVPLLLSFSITVDSWNNIKKYTDTKDAFFIFDEQRVVGYGAWTKAFLKITKQNHWILLSATPGDCWMDYVPVFIANGFYKNKTEFTNLHVIYSRYTKYPSVDRYLNTGRLMVLRNKILVPMKDPRQTERHDVDILCDYDFLGYKGVQKNRVKYLTGEPIKNASQLCYELRKCANIDASRTDKVLELVEKHERVIIFYNFDYELEILKNLNYGSEFYIAEWNGHKHEECPTGFKWVYLVQYAAGSEGWNCISSDCIIFYSQTYSYKVLEQAKGRIDRMNTPYKDLYYYHFISDSRIDAAIRSALKKKKNFNVNKFVGNWNEGG